jgi:hypothetical protein
VDLEYRKWHYPPGQGPEEEPDLVRTSGRLSLAFDVLGAVNIAIWLPCLVWVVSIGAPAWFTLCTACIAALWPVGRWLVLRTRWTVSRRRLRAVTATGREVVVPLEAIEAVSVWDPMNRGRLAPLMLHVWYGRGSTVVGVSAYRDGYEFGRTLLRYLRESGSAATVDADVIRRLGGPRRGR